MVRRGNNIRDLTTRRNQKNFDCGFDDKWEEERETEQSWKKRKAKTNELTGKYASLDELSEVMIRLVTDQKKVAQLQL